MKSKNNVGMALALLDIILKIGEKSERFSHSQVDLTRMVERKDLNIINDLLGNNL